MHTCKTYKENIPVTPRVIHISTYSDDFTTQRNATQRNTMQRSPNYMSKWCKGSHCIHVLHLSH